MLGCIEGIRWAETVAENTSAHSVQIYDSSYGNVFRQRKSLIASRALNSEWKVTATDNRTLGTFTSSTKFNALTGSMLAGNLEYA